ncbi:PIG-L family deacetylase [Pelagicoccus sp. SDUM812003]|uniref:PIG-L deacetylase family protein n=1 Tax=Pelagicoccus sp. SDUM812003 TaxID=3041267 RepID=UPI00280E9E83|nr:PIG-L family deacetylase [Pelagicoccus sp. SDUM812003]MDQ8203032.1 PIG-L family deacetylase [Pelagicoccus sp. SDUM812003]
MSEVKTILAIGAHPDDIEFGAGGILLKEKESGARLQLLVCSKGESGSNGTPDQREAECRAASTQLGAELQFLDLGGDGLMERGKEGALSIARVIRSLRPDIVLAPSLVENQHPDHAVIGNLVRDAARLARYAGLDALKDLASHSIESLYFYAITPGAEPQAETPLCIDISSVFDSWLQLMRCHASQMKTRHYVDLQVARSRSIGLQMGTEHAQAIYANDRLILETLSESPKGARTF